MISGTGMRRREFIGLVGGAAAAWPLVAQAQQPGRIRRIGILSGFPEDHPEGQAQRAALFQGLRELGWIEGKNFQIELFRWVTNNSERMHANVQELVKLNPDLLLSLSTNPPDLLALMKETTTIPIVFTNTTDPIGGGITSSLANPNINVTGFPNFEFSVAGKWMELLKQIAPTVARAALLFNPDTGHQGFLYEPYFNAAAAKLGVEPYLMTWRDAAEMERAFAAHGK
jgi:putative ABC transport system substrate-binding protein